VPTFDNAAPLFALVITPGLYLHISRGDVSSPS